MALIACPNCGRPNTSDQAPSCPNCGKNVKEIIENQKRWQEQNRVRYCPECKSVLATERRTKIDPFRESSQYDSTEYFCCRNCGYESINFDRYRR